MGSRWVLRDKRFQAALAQVAGDESSSLNNAIQGMQPFWNVEWSGATAYPDGTAYASMTDSSAAILSAVATASALGVPLIGRGTYRVDATIGITIPCDLSAATFVCSDTALAPLVRAGSTGATTLRQQFYLPKVVQAAKTGAGWSGSDVGVELVNLNTCTVHVPYIDGFRTGLYGTAAGARGLAYNDVSLGHINQCRVNVHLKPGDSGAWVNENLFRNGRLAHNATLEGTNVTGTRHIMIERNGGSLPNNNLFVKTSLEGTVAQYTVEAKAATDNRWLQCRWEGSPRIYWNDDDATYFSTDNLIDGGYNSQAIVFTNSTNSRGNGIASPALEIVDGSNANGLRRWRNRNSSGAPALMLFGSGTNPVTATPLTDYQMSMSANDLKGKAATDTSPRLTVDWANRRVEFGQGNAATDVTIGRGAADRLTMGDGDYFRTGAVAVLPTASSAYRGYTIRVEGGAGVADGLYICVKDAADAYSWKLVTLT